MTDNQGATALDEVTVTINNQTTTGGGGGSTGSSGGSYTISTPIATNSTANNDTETSPTDCRPADKFSRSTGQPCSSSNTLNAIAGCLPQYRFSPLTGQPCPTDTNTSTNTPDQSATITARVLNVRTAPGLNAKVITKLSKYDQVSVLNRSNGDWLAIKTSDNITGYISATYATVNNPQSNEVKVKDNKETAITVIAQNLNLRSVPTLTSNVLTVLPYGFTLKLINVPALSNWVQVQTNTGLTGWVNKKWVR